jgi:hypothetical protein
MMGMASWDEQGDLGTMQWDNGNGYRAMKWWWGMVGNDSLKVSVESF